jgi:gamma-glutamylcyclotransferase (GGCT)/AIG2-like uncharacterized protein YtfP
MPLLFLYGTSLEGQPDHGWVAGLRASPASVHGILWRSPNGRPALAPSPDGLPIRGVLVDVDPARLPVMDLVETAGSDAVRRARVRAASHLRSVEAEAWILALPRPELSGWRRLKATDWARVAR